MNANTNVIRNIVSFTYTPVGGNAINVVSVMECRVTDGTSNIEVGGDNAAAFMNFSGNYRCSGDVILSDPAQCEALKGKNNGSAVIVAEQINGTASNVNCTITNCSFRQAGVGYAYSNQAKLTLAFNGGQITWS